MLKIVCIGAGRLAYQLMPELELAGCEVIEVYNRTPEGAESLIRKLKSTSYQRDISQLNPNADLYFFAVSDDAIASVAGRIGYLENGHRLFIHSSGILPVDILPFRRRAIFYPLQSFSPAHQVDWKNTPILITTESDTLFNILKPVADKISNLVYSISADHKSRLHLAAVFANNFSNHMLTLAEEICLDHHLSFEILKPLIRETFEKALAAGPSHSQTGPAIRGDEKTIEKHLMMLADQKELKDLYLAITRSIQAHRKVN